MGEQKVRGIPSMGDQQLDTSQASNIHDCRNCGLHGMWRFFFFKSVHYFREFTRTLQGGGEKERSVKYIFLSIPAELDA